MKLYLVCMIALCLTSDTNRVSQYIPDVRHYVSNEEFMRSELAIDVLYNQEMAILTSIQNERIN
jgi:hypothetical protein